MSGAGRALPLVATDLDRTLIYSRAAAQALVDGSGDGSGGGPGAVVAVERYQDADASFMTSAAAEVLASLHEHAVVVPTTTRTPEQLARITLPGPPARWAIAANGGVLLLDGRPDPAWADTVERRLGEVAALGEVQAHLAAVCDPGWSTVRTACAMFCYAVLDLDRVPSGLVEAEQAWAGERGWRVSLQGRKLYWVPRPLTKSAAVAEVRRRTSAPGVLAAGDSLLDADLLLAADAGIAARHGELVASGWRAPHVEVTDAVGLAAGEEVVAWFARHLGQGPGPGARVDDVRPPPSRTRSSP